MPRFKQVYESFRPLIVWLGLGELGWISFWLLRPGDLAMGYVVTVVGWIVAMLAWLLVAIYLGMRGFFLTHTRWLSNLVGVVLVVLFGVALFGATSVAREGLARAAAEASAAQLVAIHVLRLLAIGTVVKYLQRELPLHFILWGALPDFLFAVSAVVLLLFFSIGEMDGGFLIAWHAVGFSLFLGAGISMFLSVPSPFRIYHNKPDARIVFEYPMVLAPNYTVSLFMLAHVFALVRLLAV